ncbi:TMEM14 family protein [Dioscorea alata]|uniref:TMEM14 family protein n=1 Tax=Dioscorea alata TaxID=55571 RepID=A0ACB7VGX1_DIOAL|nr:TMEM14 family protein [Dioscorea alata]
MASTKLKGECFFSSLHLTSQMSLLLHLIEPDWLQRSSHCYQLYVPFARIHGYTGDSFQQHCVDKYSKTRLRMRTLLCIIYMVWLGPSLNGGFVFGVGLIGTLFSRSLSSLVTSTLFGGTILVPSACSLKIWPQGKSSLPFILEQAGSNIRCTP